LAPRAAAGDQRFRVNRQIRQCARIHVPDQVRKALWFGERDPGPHGPRPASYSAVTARVIGSAASASTTLVARGRGR
jgi:hypothetical protein